MNKRIQLIIRDLGIKKVEFARQLKLSPPYISELCSGKTVPSDRTIADICREFDVNEHWLRTGEGEMFVELPRNEALATQIQKFLQGGTDSFRERLISLLLRLTSEQWDALEGYLLELTAPRKTALSSTDVDEQEADAEAAAVRAQVLMEKKAGAESSVSRSDTGHADEELMA